MRRKEGGLLNADLYLRTWGGGGGQNQWRVKRDLAANAGILAPPSSHIKDQRNKVHAFQTESGTKHNYESILGCHTLECSEQAVSKLSARHSVFCLHS